MTIEKPLKPGGHYLPVLPIIDFYTSSLNSLTTVPIFPAARVTFAKAAQSPPSITPDKYHTPFPTHNSYR